LVLLPLGENILRGGWLKGGDKRGENYAIGKIMGVNAVTKKEKRMGVG